MFIIDDILLAPLMAVLKVAEILAEEVDKELYDIEKIKQQLLNLQYEFDSGSITLEELEEMEKKLIQRLREASLRKNIEGREQV